MSIGGVGSSGGGIDYQSLSEMRQKMFGQMDQNGDGSISKSEFQATADKRAQETGQTIDVNKVFAAVDTNQDGVIDKTENDAAMEQMHHHRHPQPQDAAGDLTGLLDKIFAAMDTNHDGVVDQTEYDTAMKQINGQQAGSTASAASSSGTTDSAATTANSTAAAADTNKDSTLLSLIQQLLQNMMGMEKYQNSSASSGSQNSTVKSSYA